LNQYIERALRLTTKELSSKTKSDTGYTFLHALAGFTRDRAVLRDQLVAVLLAGRDTTAGCLSWTLWELARRPEIVRKLRAEILEKVGPEGGRRPTYEDLKDMPYLKDVINESLRLYPVVPFNLRIALRDTTLPRGGGPDGTLPIPILKDTPIGYSVLVMQRDRNLYPSTEEGFPDPLEFCPERWENWHPKSHYYIPFNAGPRICVGQRFALTEIAYVLCRMFQKYDRVESRMGDLDGQEPRLKADITLRPMHGVKVAFREAK
jgi:cytochrome P450